MRKLERYDIARATSVEDLVELVKYMCAQYDYEIIGGAFWNGFQYCQTMVKYSN